MRWLLVAVVLANAADAARGAEVTDVASSFEDGNVFDFRFRLRYEHLEKRARLRREAPGATFAQLNPDLTYAESRDTIGLRAELGLYHDLSLHLELPIVAAMTVAYGFDESVSAASSSTVRDAIAQPGDPPFVGIRRGASAGSGLDAFDTFNFGLTWAPFSQRRDDTKPTWVLAFEGQIGFGTIRRAASMNNRGVSDGVHRFVFRTIVSKRVSVFDPYVAFWYLLPIPRDDSLFIDYGRAQRGKNPQQQAGLFFGTEIVPYEKKGHKISFDLRGRIDGRFSGRGYSEAFELLAGAPALACDPAQNPACGLQNPYAGATFTGVTAIENYASLGADFAFAAQISKYFRLRFGLEYTHDQSHFVTNEDIGEPATPGGRIQTAAEFNPAYRPLIDLPGRRYRVDSVHLYNLFASAHLLF